jgi:hypothetical protein
VVDPAIRDALLAEVVAALREDERIVGAVLVGSGAFGFRDEESDLDVIAVVGREHDATAVYQEWGPRLDRRLPMFYRARPSPFHLANRLYGTLLDAAGQLLELDLSFTPIDELHASGEHWRVLFDRTTGRDADDAGEVQARMAAGLPKLPPLDASLSLLDAACHRIRECRKALRRGQVWYAALALHELQELTLRLACLTRFEDARRRVSTQRLVDDLPTDLLAAVAITAVPVERAALAGALRQLAPVAFDEARALYRQAGEPFPEHLAAALLAQLD